MREDAIHVDEDIRKARSLPPASFIDRDFLQQELDTIFRSSWLFIPQRTMSELRDDSRSLADLVARRGSRAPFSLLDRPLFLQRDWEGTLRAFPNVCTHAWHTLVQGPDRARSITCPQHGRQFDVAGKCLTQTGFDKDSAPDFPDACDHLTAFPVGEWGAMPFVCLGEPAAPFEDVMKPVFDSLANMPIDAFQRRPTAGEARELAGNWKQHAWNYMDSLHIPHIHKKPGGLADAIDMASYQTELYPAASLQWAYAKNPEDGFDPAHLPERFRDPDDPSRRVFALWWFVFPNLTLNFYPWGLSVNVYAPVPEQPQRTLFLWYHFVWDEEKYAQRHDRWLMLDVDLEDVDALTQVARGVKSGFAAPGRFAAGAEEGPHWFHRLVAARVNEPPP